MNKCVAGTVIKRTDFVPGGPDWRTPCTEEGTSPLGIDDDVFWLCGPHHEDLHEDLRAQGLLDEDE